MNKPLITRTRSDKTVCPVCEEGVLIDCIDRVEVEHLGQKGQIENRFTVCNGCGSEQASAAEARFNKRAMIAFKKQVQGLLSGSEVRELRKRSGLNQAEAGRVFGGGPVAFSKYETNDVMQSESMDKLLRVASAVPEALNTLLSGVGLEQKLRHRV